MPLTPEDIEQRTFEVRKRGYDKTQVDRFLGEVANAYRMVVEGGAAAVLPRLDTVEAASDPGDRRPLLAQPSSGAPPPAQTPSSAVVDHGAVAGPQPGTIPQVRDPLARIGNEVAAVLEAAQQQADGIRHDAEARAAKLRAETEQWSKQVTTDAERYAAARRQEADADRQEAARQLSVARERASAAEWAQQEADRRLAGADDRVQADLDHAAQEADQILEQAERAARARVEGILADADRRLEEAAAALGTTGAPPRAERRRPPTTPVRGGRRRTDPPVIDLVRDTDPIIDLVEGAPPSGRAGGEAPLYPVDGTASMAGPGSGAGSATGMDPAGPDPVDPLTTLLADAVGEAGEGQAGDRAPGASS